MSVASKAFADNHHLELYPLTKAVQVELADSDVKKTVKHYVKIDIVLNLVHGPVMLHQVKVGVMDINMQELILGRPVLAYLDALPEMHIQTGSFNLEEVPLMLEQDANKLLIINQDYRFEGLDIMQAMTELKPLDADELDGEKKGRDATK